MPGDTSLVPLLLGFPRCPRLTEENFGSTLHSSYVLSTMTGTCTMHYRTLLQLQHLTLLHSPTLWMTARTAQWCQAHTTLAHCWTHTCSAPCSFLGEAITAVLAVSSPTCMVPAAVLPHPQQASHPQQPSAHRDVGMPRTAPATAQPAMC